MKKKIALSLVAFALAFALPVSSAFAAASPSADSPSVDSPSVDSPSVDSPSVDSPSVDSPSVDSPSVDSPSVDSPAINATNVAANSIGGTAVHANAITNATSEGALLSPHSGALNLAVVAGATVLLFAVAGIAAWALRRKLHQ